MGKNTVVFWFRLFLMVSAAAALVTLVRSPYRWTFLPYCSLVTGTLFFWLFSEIVVCLRRLIDQNEANTPSSDNGLSLSLTKGHKDPSEVLLDMANYKRLGDRVFKADGTKTCKNCKSLKSEEMLCLVDGACLQGITISAVGCQHWQPALKVTGTPDPNAPNGTSKRTPPVPPQQEA